MAINRKEYNTLLFILVYDESGILMFTEGRYIILGD